MSTSLRFDIEQIINSHSAENGSDTPDFILAEFLTDCLTAFDKTTNAREKWYGREKTNDGGNGSVPETTEVNHERTS
jgi:hypothetical protein